MYTISFSNKSGDTMFGYKYSIQNAPPIFRILDKNVNMNFSYLTTMYESILPNCMYFWIIFNFSF